MRRNRRRRSIITGGRIFVGFGSRDCLMLKGALQIGMSPESIGPRSPFMVFPPSDELYSHQHHL